jgi:hypothetical protein
MTPPLWFTFRKRLYVAVIALALFGGMAAHEELTRPNPNEYRQHIQYGHSTAPEAERT